MKNKFAYKVSSAILEDMALLTSPQALARLTIDNKPINWRTFLKLAEINKIEPDQILPQGTKLWDEEKIAFLATKLPKERIRGSVGFFKKRKK